MRMKVSELLSSPARWRKGAWCEERSEGGDESKFHTDWHLRDNQCGIDLDLCCFCLDGAISYCYPDTNERYEVYAKVKEAIRKLFPTETLQIINFNDNHSYEDVMRVVREAGV